MALPNLATDNPIGAFMYSLKPHLKGFTKVKAQAIMDASLNEVIRVALIQSKTSCMVFKKKTPSIPFGNLYHKDRWIIYKVLFNYEVWYI